MTMQRWQPFGDLRQMERSMDEFWRRFWPGSMAEREAWYVPLDVRQTDDTIEVEASLPGVDPADINVSIENDILTINVEKTEEERTDGQYVLRERRVGRFHRALRLPGKVQTEGITSHLENGVLRIRIPKAEEQRARKIPVLPGGGSEAESEGQQQLS